MFPVRDLTPGDSRRRVAPRSSSDGRTKLLAYREKEVGMRLFDIVEKHLPRQAGKAEIRWSTCYSPRRDDSVITLPLCEECWFIPP